MLTETEKMNKRTLLYSALVLLGVLISTASQVILKKRSSVKSDSIIKEYLNLPVIIAYAMFFGATLLSVAAYTVIPMTLGVILESTSYIFITAAGVIFFKEKVSIRKLGALCLMITGIIIFSL